MTTPLVLPYTAGGGSRFSYGKEKECNELDDTEAHQRPYQRRSEPSLIKNRYLVRQPPKKHLDDRLINETLGTPLNQKSRNKSQTATIANPINFSAHQA